jgi:two-component system, LytTR family, response regulator AlgR
MLDIVIVDDESLARQRLQRMVTELGYEVTGEAKNASEALAIITEQDPSVVLLDIEMPGETGLQLAEKIAQLDQPPAVIFTTAYDRYALEAFNTFAAGYLLKPINREKLQQALVHAQMINKAQLANLPIQGLTQPSAQQHLTAKSHRGVELIPIESIRCFHADSKYITVVGTKGESLMDGTLKQFESDFADSFVRIHRNALVAIAYIEGLDRVPEGHYTVRLQGIATQPVVSRRYASKIKDLLSRL